MDYKSLVLMEELDDSLLEYVSMDLKHMSGLEFKKKYGKDKYNMRKVISAQPLARKHFGYAPTGNMKGKWAGSISVNANPQRKDTVTGVAKKLAYKQPTAKIHRKGVTGAAGGRLYDSYAANFGIALDEFAVTSLSELSNADQVELLSAVDTLRVFTDDDGNSYGPFWHVDE